MAQPWPEGRRTTRLWQLSWTTASSMTLTTTRASPSSTIASCSRRTVAAPTRSSVWTGGAIHVTLTLDPTHCLDDLPGNITNTHLTPPTLERMIHAAGARATRRACAERRLRTSRTCGTDIGGRPASLLACIKGRKRRAAALPRAGATSGRAPTFSTGLCPMAPASGDDATASHVLPAQAWGMVVPEGGPTEARRAAAPTATVGAPTAARSADAAQPSGAQRRARSATPRTGRRCGVVTGWGRTWTRRTLSKAYAKLGSVPRRCASTTRSELVLAAESRVNPTAACRWGSPTLDRAVGRGTAAPAHGCCTV